MPSTDLLKQFGLSRNPFTDRTAEKTVLDSTSMYVHSDLQGFSPSETTYIFFGKRGSGKTTIRIQMQESYNLYNQAARASGKSRGHFLVDLTRPGHLTACLRNFQEAIGCSDDNWDSSFCDNWTSADMVDCILCYAVTQLVSVMTDPASAEGREHVAAIKGDACAARQFLILAHLYAKTDAAGLASLRRQLLPPRFPPAETAVGLAAGVGVLGGAAVAVKDERVASAVAEPFVRVWDEVGRLAPPVHDHPRLVLACTAAATGLTSVYLYRSARRRALERAAALTSNIRVVKQQPSRVIAALLSRLFHSSDRVDTIRGLAVGVSAHQKLDKLLDLVKLLGFESVTIFGDCFDEVGLLDPVQYPGCIKCFAKEVCKNDLLNFGRLHFFFPDSRLALDLNTDKTLKEARFDRHFVRDLNWSRHQLEELAERRFIAAQRDALRKASNKDGDWSPELGDTSFNNTSFADLFKKVKVEDFSSYLAKIGTPRELMIMMTEMLARIEANPEKGLEGQDMEIAVNKALEQAV